MRLLARQMVRQGTAAGKDDNPWVIVGKSSGAHLTDIQKPWRGIRARAGLDDMRIHDLRQTFAVRALESTLSAERRDVGRHMLTLSTYLGHSNTADTYWYLEATPVLLRQVSKRRWRH